MSEAIATRMEGVGRVLGFGFVRRSLRLPIVLLAAIVVAEAGVVILRPDPSGPPPPPVEPQAYFSEDHLERAEGFRSSQLALYGVRLAVEVGVLAAFVARPPRRLVSFGRRPVVAGALTGAAISLSLGAATLPVRIAAREEARDVGLITQDWSGYAADVLRGEAIGAVIAAGGGALLVVALRRFGRAWWAAGAAVIVAYGIVLTYLAPVVLEPLYNDFEPLPAGPLRSQVLAMADRAGVEVGEVYEVDASRRTTAANAYVAGLGQTKRVVLYDNLLRDFEPDEVRLIVAHELAHVRYSDVPRALLFLVLVAPVGMLAVAGLAPRWAPGGRLEGAAAVPSVALATLLVITPLSVISNQLSRAVERRADAYALELTQDPEAMIAMQQRLSVRNVADPDPPAWVTLLLSTHPPTLDRIAQAEVWRERGSAGSAERGS
jgi:STE24 endopeptidase